MIRTRPAAATLVAAAVVFAMAAPSYAQRGERRHGNGQQQQHAQARATAAPPQARQARPHDQGQRAHESRPQAQRAQPRANFQPQDRSRSSGQQRRSQPRETFRQPAPPRNSYRAPSTYQAPAQPRHYARPSQNFRGDRDRHVDEWRYVSPRSYRPSYGARGNYNGGYHGGYQSYRPYRSYAVPYGYRRHGSRGWSFNLYFGRPYGYYGYGRSAAYGYYPIPSGYVLGSVRIVDAPPDAQVFVDGYYAGVVDDYDGVFQHLNLVPGPHRIDIQLPGYAPIGFDVFVQPGQTITYRANLY